MAVDRVVHVAGPVGVRPDIDDRHRRHTSAGVVDPSGRESDPKRVAIGDRARGDDLAIDIMATDAFVEIDELLDRDGADVKRFETVLNTDVVERPACEPGLRIAPED